jgi:hypothetical protein
MVPRAGAISDASSDAPPRRARHLVPKGLPRRTEAVAAAAVAVLAVHLVLAQVTLLLVVAFFVVGKVSRWRRSWLLIPALAGLGWVLAIGPGPAIAGFTVGPGSILWHLAGGHLAGKAGHPFAGFASPWRWLPGQFPVALVAGAAEAALLGWLDWLHTDEWAVPPPRPGLVAAVRRRWTDRAVRSGAVVTRDGCALGVDVSTGAPASLTWAALGACVLVTGAAAQDVTLTGLQIVHAALRRRKPVIVFSPADPSISRAVSAACFATGVPLGGRPGGGRPAAGVPLTGGPLAGGASPSGAPTGRPLTSGALAGESDDSAGAGYAVRSRSAVLLPTDSLELAAKACAAVTSVAADLRRIGVDGDALVWVPHGEGVPDAALTELISGCAGSGVGVLVGATAPEVVTRVAEAAGAVVSFQIIGRELAERLAMRTGSRLVPAPDSARVPAPDSPSDPPQYVSRPNDSPQYVASPAVAPSTLLTLGPGEFVLGGIAQPGIVPGRLVPGRLPEARRE